MHIFIFVKKKQKKKNERKLIFIVIKLTLQLGRACLMPACIRTIEIISCTRTTLIYCNAQVLRMSKASNNGCPIRDLIRNQRIFSNRMRMYFKSRKHLDDEHPRCFKSQCYLANKCLLWVAYSNKLHSRLSSIYSCALRAGCCRLYSS